MFSLCLSGATVSNQLRSFQNIHHHWPDIHRSVHQNVVFYWITRYICCATVFYCGVSIFLKNILSETGTTAACSHELNFSWRSAVLLAIIVEKSKKCLDFSVTLFLIHLGFCTVYSGLPKTWDWWIVNILGTIIMILLGEYVCSLREMSDIPLLQIWFLDCKKDIVE